MNKLVMAAVGTLAFAGVGVAQADTILLNDPVVVESSSIINGNSIADLGSGPGTFTLGQASTVVIEGITSTNSGITGVAYITGSSTGAFDFDMGIGAGQIDTATATLGAGTYYVTYGLSNSNILPSSENPSAADNLVDIQVDSVSAPEIDPASAASGLTLLAGALLVLRGRRRTTSAVSFA
jgi:predicted RNA methylase